MDKQMDQSNSRKALLLGNAKNILFCVIAMFSFQVFPSFSFGQQFQTDTISALSLENAVNLALDNNLSLKNAELAIKKAQFSKKEAFQIHPTNLGYWNGQLHQTTIDQAYLVTQSIGSPIESYYLAQQAKSKKGLRKNELELKKQQIEREAKLSYFDWVYLHNKKKLVKARMDYYKEFQRILNIQNKLGEVKELERINAESLYYQSTSKLKKIRNQISIAENKLKLLLNTNHTLIPQSDSLKLYQIEHRGFYEDTLVNPVFMDYLQQKVRISKMNIKTTKAKLFPGITAGYFNQQINNNEGFDGWMIGLSIPLWLPQHNASIQKAKANYRIAENNLSQELKRQNTEIKNLVHQLNSQQEDILFFHDIGLHQAEVLIHTARKRYEKEEIEYDKFMEKINKAYELKIGYLEAIKNYNKTAVKLEFYIN